MELFWFSAKFFILSIDIVWLAIEEYASNNSSFWWLTYYDVHGMMKIHE